eukprot:3187946-Rhodomonas_salina.1
MVSLGLALAEVPDPPALAHRVAAALATAANLHAPRVRVEAVREGSVQVFLALAPDAHRAGLSPLAALVALAG